MPPPWKLRAAASAAARAARVRCLLAVPPPDALAGWVVRERRLLGGSVDSYVRPVDWWSLGIMLHVMLTGDLVFDIQTLHEIDRAPPEVRSQAQRERISSASVGPPDATDLVMRLLIFEPAHRLGTNGGAEAGRAHSVFAAIDWARLERLELPPRLPVLAGAASARPEFVVGDRQRAPQGPWW